MMDKFVEKAYILADEEIENLVIDSLKKNNNSIQEAIKHPSEITTTNPYFGHSILSYITQSVFFLLRKLEERNFEFNNEESLRFILKKEILNIHYENHKRYIDSSNAKVREEHLKKMSEISKKIDDLEKQRVKNSEEEKKSSSNINVTNRNKMLEFAGKNFRKYSDEKLKKNRHNAKAEFFGLCLITKSGLINKYGEIEKYKYAKVITLANAELENRGYKSNNIDVIKKSHPNYESELARLQEFGTIDEYINWLDKQY